jgi:hypothetical protein
MTEVIPTGVFFSGRCDIQAEDCTATETGPITAVWMGSTRDQVNVCRACLESMIRAGDWSVLGAKITSHFDLGVVGPHNEALLAAPLS